MISEDLPRLPFPGLASSIPRHCCAPCKPARPSPRSAPRPEMWPGWSPATPRSKALFADPRLGRSHPDPDNAARISHTAILAGPSGNAATEVADHALMRRLLTPAFSARRMQALRAHVTDLVETLLDELAEQDPPADLHEALSFSLSALVICELLGVPYEDRDQFRDWSTGMGNLTDRTAAAAALGALVNYMYQLIAHNARTRPSSPT